MSKPIFHDLKQDRPDLSPPLPPVLMALPVLTCLTLVGSLGLGGYFMWEKQKAEKETAELTAQAATEDAESLKLGVMLKDIHEESARAKEVAEWMKWTRPLSYQLAAITTSLSGQNTLSSLNMSRRDNNPDWIEMRLVLNNGGNQQIGRIVKKIESLGYQQAFEDTKLDKAGAATLTATWAPNGGSVSALK